MSMRVLDCLQCSHIFQVGHALVCSEYLGDTTPKACLDGECERCGVARFWSKGLRQTIDENDTFWAREISWDTLKAGNDEGHSSTENDIRHTVTGTLIDCMDSFEEVQRNWLPHRYHAVQAKAVQSVSSSKI